MRLDAHRMNFHAAVRRIPGFITRMAASSVPGYRVILFDDLGKPMITVTAATATAASRLPIRNAMPARLGTGTGDRHAAGEQRSFAAGDELFVEGQPADFF